MDGVQGNTSFELIEVSDRVVVAQYKEIFQVNATAIALESFIVVIDVLYFPRQGSEFRNIIEKRFNLPVKYVFITHHHGDHHFGLRAFSDVEIFGSNVLIENMKRKREESWTTESFDVWKVQEPEFAEFIDEIEIILPQWGFDEKYKITNNDLQIEFYYSGGSSSCSAYAYFPVERLLITGDDLIADDWPYITEPSGNPERWKRTLRDMLSLQPETIIPGHGRIITTQEIEEQLIFLEELTQIVQKGIAKGIAPEDWNLPEFYEPRHNWQIPSGLRNLNAFYSSLALKGAEAKTL